jgi:hypothetical protein
MNNKASNIISRLVLGYKKTQKPKHPTKKAKMILAIKSAEVADQDVETNSGFAYL